MGNSEIKTLVSKVLCQVLGWDSLNLAPSLRLRTFLCLIDEKSFLCMTNKPLSASLKKSICYH